MMPLFRDGWSSSCLQTSWYEASNVCCSMRYHDNGSLLLLLLLLLLLFVVKAIICQYKTESNSFVFSFYSFIFYLFYLNNLTWVSLHYCTFCLMEVWRYRVSIINEKRSFLLSFEWNCVYYSRLFVFIMVIWKCQIQRNVFKFNTGLYL